MKTKNLLKKGFLALALAGTAAVASSCKIEDLFIFSNSRKGGIDIELLNKGIENFDGTENSIFFALYNYYGYEGQSFTNRWMGMNDALANHGIEVTNWQKNKDAKTFKIKRLPSCDLPADAEIFMVNNQQWDSGIQFSKPIANKKPMAIISTCNGAEFASAPIASSGIAISNGTMAGFSTFYKEKFETGTMHYLSAKTAASILPIVQAAVDAVDKGSAMRMPNGEALVIESANFPIQTIEEYKVFDEADSIGENGKTPLYKKANLDEIFEARDSQALLDWASAHKSKSSILTSYETNKTVQDTKRTGSKLKCGIIQPSAVNDQVKKYIDYVSGYCADVFNLEVITCDVTASVKQFNAVETLCNSNCDFIVSFQDDTDRVAAIQKANEKHVYFAAGGACINPVDYPNVKDLPYFVGSAGTTVENDREATREMTEYYLQCMIERAKGKDALYDYQCGVKGLDKASLGL